MALIGPERVPEYTTREVVLGAALAAGATVREAAEAIGVSERYCYKLLEKDDRFISAVRELLKPVITINKREVQQIAIERATEEFQARLGKFMAALDKATDSDDPRTALEAAKEGFNRIFGKAAANVTVSGGIKHEHIAIVPPETLATLNSVIASSKQLYDGALKMLPPVIDV